jgi:hypothetical protein
MEELDPEWTSLAAFGNIVITCIPAKCESGATIHKEGEEYPAGGGQNMGPTVP